MADFTPRRDGIFKIDMKQIDCINSYMHKIDFRKVDLNLMKAFDALWQEESVTKAADTLGIGQPAMSHALARLRVLFNDELFVRTSDCMVPTKRADSAIGNVRRAMNELEQALRTDLTFDPAGETFQLTLGMTDYPEATLLPALLEVVSRTAPNAFIKVRQVEPRLVTPMLLSGKADLVVGSYAAEASWVEREVLLADYNRCIFSKRLIDVPVPISLEDYASHRHVARKLGRNNMTFADRELAVLGRSRHVAAAVPRFTTLPQILMQTPLIATLPARIIGTFAQNEDLISSDLPFDPHPFDVAMLWHSMRTHDPAHAWLREILRGVVLQLRSN